MSGYTVVDEEERSVVVYLDFGNGADKLRAVLHEEQEISEWDTWTNVCWDVELSKGPVRKMEFQTYLRAATLDFIGLALDTLASFDLSQYTSTKMVHRVPGRGQDDEELLITADIEKIEQSTYATQFSFKHPAADERIFSFRSPYPGAVKGSELREHVRRMSVAFLIERQTALQIEAKKKRKRKA